jgi:preprotein translocase subunit SecA
MRSRGLSPVDTPNEYEQAWPEALERAQRAVEAEHDEVVASGGLYVLGTERHESRRIDNQLRGRSGRQGDPGLSRFYLSLGDDLMRLFNAGAVESIMTRMNIPDDQPIESKMVSRAIRSAQTQVEQQNFEIRKNVLKYDEVLNRQRTVIYDERRKVLEGADLHEQVRHMVDDAVEGYVVGATAEGYPEDWDLEQLWTALGTLYPVGLRLEDYDADRSGLSTESLVSDVQADAQAAYDRREESLGAGPEGEPVMRELERRVLLSVMDRKWREHLYEMDYLQEGIGLRAMGQRDPLVEYQREGFDMFTAMMEAIKEESVGFLFNVEVQVKGQGEAAAVQADVPTAAPPAELVATGPGEQPGEIQVERLADAAPSGVAGSPVASPAPAAREDEPSLEAESPQLPTPVAGPGAGTRPPTPAPATPAPAAPAPPSAPSAPAARTGLPEAFGRPQQPSRLQYSAPTVDGEAGRDGVTRSSGPGGAADGGQAPGPAGHTAREQSRNSPCFCGSGRKYKRCHGDPRNVAS